MKLVHEIVSFGIMSRVFNHTAIKTFLALKQVSQFNTYDEGYQRQRDEEHEKGIIEYLKTSSHRYLPDIVVSIRHNDIEFENKSLLRNNDFLINKIQAYNTARVKIKTKSALKSIKIIDGNHRISAIKKILEDGSIVDFDNFKIGVTFILTHNRKEDFENEMALFYYLNSKAKQLLPNDYLSDATKNLSETKAQNIDWWLYIFKKSNKRLSEIFEHKFKDIRELQVVISLSCDYIASKIDKDDFQTLPFFLDIIDSLFQENLINNIIDEFIKKEQFANFINIVFFLFQKYDNNEIDKKLKDFYEWLIKYAQLENFDNFENLYQTYKKTYIPHDYKIFVAMEFKNNDSTYKAIEGSIKNVARELNLPLECERIDKLNKGNTYQIMDEILKKIRHNGLLIADITNKNPNVYLEVGYAMGLAKSKNIGSQIMLLVEDKGKNTEVGFDLQSYQQIRYTDTEDLRVKLESQLRVYYSKLIE